MHFINLDQFILHGVLNQSGFYLQHKLLELLVFPCSTNFMLQNLSTILFYVDYLNSRIINQESRLAN